MSVHEVLELLDDATARLVTTVRALEPGDLEKPSRLAGWSRSHVLNHLVGNANGMRNLLLAARSGELVRMYANPNARGADIAAGITRPFDVIVDDVCESARRFLLDAGATPEPTWASLVQITSGLPPVREVTASTLLAMRLVEVEIHTIDLDAGRDFADIPERCAAWLQSELARRSSVSARDEGSDPRLVVPLGPDEHWRCSGTRAAVLAWLAGRSDAAGITVESGELPSLPGLG